MAQKFTPDEDAIIAENYPHSIIEDWMHLLPGRGRTSIHKRAVLLGLQPVDRDSKLKSKAIRRFFSGIKKDSITGCWEWSRTKNNHGYGMMGVCTDAILVHRYSWMHHYGEIPDGLIVCHKCDNPPCANPEHLFLGTHKDNVHDKISKGRDANTRNALRAANAFRSKNKLKAKSIPVTKGVMRSKKASIAKEPSKARISSGVKLTPEQVKEIKFLLRGGVKQAHVAKKFSVSRTTILFIKQGKMWRHIE